MLLDYPDFNYYYFYRPSRQYYGIAAVGYDIKKKQKIPIFDGEGEPEWPDWLIQQFDRLHLNYERPEEEMIAYFNN